MKKMTLLLIACFALFLLSSANLLPLSPPNPSHPFGHDIVLIPEGDASLMGGIDDTHDKHDMKKQILTN